MTIILAIILGSAFGFALYEAGAAYRFNLRSMLRLEDLSLMKTIMFAIGLASFWTAIGLQTGIVNVGHLSVKAMNGGVIAGGIIFGLGFGFVGSCPGTALASLPFYNKIKTLGIIVGGLAGAAALSLTYSFWQASGLLKALDYGKITFFALSPKFPSVFSIGTPGLMVAGILFIAAAFFLPVKVSGKNN